MRNLIRNSAGAAIALVLLLSSHVACLASSAKVAYADGTPAAGAEVKLLFDDTSGSGGEEMTLFCDGSGRFSFPAPASREIKLQIKAADGENFAMFTLPIRLFNDGEVAIVLQSGR